MATKLEAARQLTQHAARRHDSGERADLEAGMAKLFASEAAMEIALNALRIHGGYGYSTEFDVERYFRDAPLMIVGEGTNEIQRNVIARQLVKRHPAAPDHARELTACDSLSTASPSSPWSRPWPRRSRPASSPTSARGSSRSSGRAPATSPAATTAPCTASPATSSGSTGARKASSSTSSTPTTVTCSAGSSTARTCSCRTWCPGPPTGLASGPRRCGRAGPG